WSFALKGEGPAPAFVREANSVFTAIRRAKRPQAGNVRMNICLAIEIPHAVELHSARSGQGRHSLNAPDIQTVSLSLAQVLNLQFRVSHHDLAVFLDFLRRNSDSSKVDVH